MKTAAPTHILLQHGAIPDGMLPSTAAMQALSPEQQAEKIVRSLMAGSGPILLCMPGTLGPSYQHAIAATARSLIRMHGGPVSIASMPYPNTVLDNAKRFFARGRPDDNSVLSRVVRTLHKRAPHRPILIVGESQGAWAIAADLLNPEVARGVTRAVMFAKPGFQRLPEAVAQAGGGAQGLPGPSGLLLINHTDDIVPALFSGLSLDVAGGFMHALKGLFEHGSYGYRPHHYAEHGAEAARFLLTGRRPTVTTMPSSHAPIPAEYVPPGESAT